MRSWIGLSVMAVWVGSSVACAPPAPPVAQDTRPSGPVQWGYGREDGPAVWGDLSVDYDLCATGTRQSPVDLRSVSAAEPEAFTFDYKDSAIELVNDGRTVRATYDPGSEVDIGGQRFGLRELHFHAPSEHTVGGRSFPAEVHFGHQSSAGDLAVIAAFLDVGRHSDALAPVLDRLPTTIDLPRAVLDNRLSAAAILGSVGEVMRYDGSLTKPPCTEGVRWFVLADAIAVDDAQIEQLRAVVYDNSRPVQPRNNRTIVSARR
ncbi:MAG: carbonic anhydrase family protein [Acidobacteria bacterium]|nr:carbonic anhydrase family protein [Acidobacteriota bacterium]